MSAKEDNGYSLATRLWSLEGIKGLASIGGWIVVSLFFMGQTAGYIKDQPVAHIQAKIEEHDGRAEATRISLEEHRRRQEQLIDRLTTALRVMCENGARSQQETNNCRNIR